MGSRRALAVSDSLTVVGHGLLSGEQQVLSPDMEGNESQHEDGNQRVEFDGGSTKDKRWCSDVDPTTGGGHDRQERLGEPDDEHDQDHRDRHPA